MRHLTTEPDLIFRERAKHNWLYTNRNVSGEKYTTGTGHSETKYPKQLQRIQPRKRL